MQQLPEIRKVYAFYDDGKVGASRQYLAMVTRIIPIKDTHRIYKNGFDITEEDSKAMLLNEKFEFIHTLYEYWQYNITEYDWVFSQKSNYLIECVIPEYDDHLIYFACRENGGWFSLDIQNHWQGGSLDINGENDEYLQDKLKEKRSKNIL